MENKSGIRAPGKMPQRHLRNWLDPTHLNMCMYLNHFSFRKESHVVPCLHGPLKKCFPNSDMWALRNLSILILGVLTMSQADRYFDIMCVILVLQVCRKRAETIKVSTQIQKKA